MEACKVDMDKEEVLDAKIALASLTAASLLNSSIFAAAFSTIASIKSQP